jgi:predicted PhzF superfamily epimerase YddE/YHI9
LSARLGGVSVRAFLGGRFEMAVLESADAVRAATPDLRSIRDAHARGLIITAAGEKTGEGKGPDVVSRFFAPHSGNDEDPVTGSVHCAIVPYWAGRLDKRSLHCRQLSTRGGDLYCALAQGRVTIEGAVQFYMEGSISV